MGRKKQIKGKPKETEIPFYEERYGPYETKAEAKKQATSSTAKRKHKNIRIEKGGPSQYYVFTTPKRV